MAKTEIKKEEKIDIESIKNELKDYVNIKVKNGIENEIASNNKKIINEKNRRLFYKNIIIILLLIVIGYLVFLLYKEDFFANNKKYNEITPNNNIINNNKEQNKENEQSISLEELISKYSYLLDNIYISEDSEYINNYYSGNLSVELKSYLALNNVSQDDLTLEENYNIFESSILKKSYSNLFNDELNCVSFSYNSNRIRYINKLDSYLSEIEIKKVNSNIKREIVGIDVNDNEIKITTVEGLVKDDKLYNAVTQAEIINYKDGNISNYKDELNTITYTFNNEKLLSIK